MAEPAPTRKESFARAGAAHAVKTVLANYEWLKALYSGPASVEEIQAAFSARIGDPLQVKVSFTSQPPSKNKPRRPQPPAPRLDWGRPDLPRRVVDLAGYPGLGKTWLGREAARRRPDITVYDHDDIRTAALLRLARPGAPVPHWREVHRKSSQLVQQLADAAPGPVLFVGAAPGTARDALRLVLRLPGGPAGREASERAYRRLMLRELDKVRKNAAAALGVLSQPIPDDRVSDVLGGMFHFAIPIGISFEAFCNQARRWGGGTDKLVVTVDEVLGNLDALFGPPSAALAGYATSRADAAEGRPARERLGGVAEALAVQGGRRGAPGRRGCPAPPAPAGSALELAFRNYRCPKEHQLADRAPRNRAEAAYFAFLVRVRELSSFTPVPKNAPLVAGRVAVLVPYRDNPLQGRAKQLAAFLELWQGASRGTKWGEVDVFVVEQTDGSKFNRGLLLNAGFLAASARHPYSAYIFHDVDSVPDDRALRNYFIRPDRPLQIGSKQVFDRPVSSIFFGGVTSLSGDTFRAVGGFPNDFNGWGNEDLALLDRLVRRGFRFWTATEGRLFSMPHPPSHADPKLANPNRWELQVLSAKEDSADAEAGRPARNGLGSVEAALTRPWTESGKPPLICLLVDPKPAQL